MAVQFRRLQDRGRIELNTMIADGPEPTFEPEAAESWLTPARFACLLGLLIVAAFPGVLLAGRAFAIRDFAAFSYPIAHFHRECFWQGTLPLWNPLSSCGTPFLAQWNTLVLYPFSLIYLLLPLSWSLSFFCLAHLFWGGLGMYFLACRWTRHRLAAAVAGVIFSFNGLSLNFLMWPSHAATFAWLPWVLWLAREAWREGGRKLGWASLAGAMQMLAGGPETIFFTWLILFLLACGDWIKGDRPRQLILVRFLTVALVVALVSSAQLLPFIELLAHSQRDKSYGSSEWSMPAWGWANFLVPRFRTYPTSQGVFLQLEQNWTSSYYAGIGTVLLAGVAVGRARTWCVRLLTVLTGVGLVLALGDGGLLYRAVRFCIPALGFMRYPVKFVILILAVAPLLAACGLAALARQRAGTKRLEWLGGLVILLLIGAVVALDTKSPIPDFLRRATWYNALTRAAVLMLILLFTTGLLKSQGRLRILLSCLLLVVFWLDFVTHVPTQNPTVPGSVYTPGWVKANLKWVPEPRPGQFRAMQSPRAEETMRLHPLPDLELNCLVSRLSLFANCNLLDDLPQVYGFFSLTPAQANEATCLPYVRTNADFSALLDFMGVAQMTAPGSLYDWAPRPKAMPLVTAGQKPVYAEDQTVIDAFFQTNIDLHRITFLPPDARGEISVTQRTAAQALLRQFSNQKIVIETEAPAPSLVVIAQTCYPAWKARIDGQPVRIWRANYAFQAVQVPYGRHELQLCYEDRFFLAGVFLSIMGLAACLGLWRFARPQQNSALQPDSTCTRTCSI
jgi:hypothetical protein